MAAVVFVIFIILFAVASAVESVMEYAVCNLLRLL
jgi:hypothetical protein